jgi:UDP-glucuronate 4-epimerase
MAYFKFVSSILNNKQIDIYNNGEMYRDFTYVDDLVNGIKLLVDCIPYKKISENYIISPVSPFRVVNIENSEKIKLIDFINAIEESLKKILLTNEIIFFSKFYKISLSFIAIPKFIVYFFFIYFVIFF